MSANLAIGITAALASLAALNTRIGSRSQKIGVRFQRARRELIYQAMRDEDDDFIGVEVFSIDNDGKSELIKKIPLWWLFDEALGAYTGVGNDFERESASEWISGLDEAIEYFSKQTFPMRIYRGLRYKGRERPRIENPGISWTPDVKIAESFADGYHAASSRGDTGHILTAIIPGPKNVDWASTLSLYVSYTAFTPGEAERQIRPNDPSEDLIEIENL